MLNTIEIVDVLQLFCMNPEMISMIQLKSGTIVVFKGQIGEMSYLYFFCLSVTVYVIVYVSVTILILLSLFVTGSRFKSLHCPF